MPSIRRAMPDDAALLAAHRHSMLSDIDFAAEARLSTMDAVFEPWVRDHLADGSYVGLLLEDDMGQTPASAGIFFYDFTPHWMDFEPLRAYLLNVYTAPEARGRGYANLLLTAAVEECRARNVAVVTLYPSKFGRSIYEKFGFKDSSEMMLRFDNLA